MVSTSKPREDNKIVFFEILNSETWDQKNFWSYKIEYIFNGVFQRINDKN